MASAAIPTRTASMIAMSTIACPRCPLHPKGGGLRWGALTGTAIGLVLRPENRGCPQDYVVGGRLRDHRGDENQVEPESDLDLGIVAGGVHRAAAACRSRRVLTTGSVH